MEQTRAAGRHSRRAFVGALGGLTVGLAGCSGRLGGGSPSTSESDDGPKREHGDDLPVRDHEVPLAHDLERYHEESLSGGVSQDGIPSIDQPVFVDADIGDDQLLPDDPVFGVEIGGDARAYAQHVLVYHEIVNDAFGDFNVAVTYCPLTGTAIGFERDGVEFGVSGKLVNSNLIMYDRSTESYWPQILGAAAHGEFFGSALHEVPVVWTTWERWTEARPDTQVLDQDNTGFGRPYGRRDPYGAYNPTQGYYTDENVIFNTFVTDDRHHPKAVFIGARSPDGAVAFEKDRLREDHQLATDVGGTEYLAVYDGALDVGYVYRNPDGVRYDRDGNSYRDADGEAHEPDALPIERVNAFDAMWFAWVAFYEDTAVVD